LNKKIVVFGAAGQLGLELCKELAQRGYQVRAFERQSLDICDADAVDGAFEEVKPSAVFNAAAWNQVDLAESDPMGAYKANALGVRYLAVACRKHDARLIHYSTDYVFDGKLGRPYVETDPTHPIGAYAVSKLAGELYAQAYLDRPIIIRTSGVFGPGGMRTARGNFPELMLRLAREGKPLRVVDDHSASPTYAPALASRSIDVLERDLEGVFHIGGGQAISWYEFAKMIFQKAGVTANLTATNAQEYKTAASRPHFSALENARLRDSGIEPMPALGDALDSYMEARQQFVK
jgi:dTDP-4-dehydrorhamnose reductase